MPCLLNIEVGNSLPGSTRGSNSALICPSISFRNQAALERFEKDPKHTCGLKAVLTTAREAYVVFPLRRDNGGSGFLSRPSWFLFSVLLAAAVKTSPATSAFAVTTHRQVMHVLVAAKSAHASRAN